MAGEERQNPFVRKIVLVAKTDGTIVRAPMRPISEMAFERQFHTSLQRGLDASTDEAASHMYWLAYDCERRLGGTIPAFDQWAETVDAIDVQTETIPFSEGPRGMA